LNKRLARNNRSVDAMTAALCTGSVWKSSNCAAVVSATAWSNSSGVIFHVFQIAATRSAQNHPSNVVFSVA
jgi:hypothetical protein